MAVFAIADLHLSHVDEKSMDIFGRHWKGHWDKIQQAWRSRIGAEDLVLIPGDISWAMHMPEAQPDLDAIGRMPGQKLILRIMAGLLGARMHTAYICQPQGLDDSL